MTCSLLAMAPAATRPCLMHAMLTSGNCAQQAAPVCTCAFQCPDKLCMLSNLFLPLLSSCREAQSGSPSHINGKGSQLVCLCVQCICSCPVAYANGPSGAPAPAPMMDPSIMPEDMAGAMDSGADADSSNSGSGCAPKPVPTQYEAFENVRSLWLR